MLVPRGRPDTRRTLSHADQWRCFPIRPGPAIGIPLRHRCCVVAFVRGPARRQRVHAQAVLIPFLMFSLAAIGLNMLTGYTGLLSLGTGAFMGVGAYRLLQAHDRLSAASTSSSGSSPRASSRPRSASLFGLPSLRIKGFYLAVATLAAQFFLSWCFIRVPWLYNYNVSGAIEVPTRTCSACRSPAPTATPMTRYLVVLSIVVVMTWFASNLVHGRIGRMWMAVRDMDIAAELIGIRLLPTKLLAFAVSSFYCGVAGAHAGVPLVRRRRGRGVRHQPELLHPVHGHHRRARQPDRLVLRRRADLRPADRAARARAGRSACRSTRRPSSTHSS